MAKLGKCQGYLFKTSKRGFYHSLMSEKRIKHPLEVLSVNQYLARIRVISVEVEKQKVGLSLEQI